MPWSITPTGRVDNKSGETKTSQFRFIFLLRQENDKTFLNIPWAGCGLLRARKKKRSETAQQCRQLDACSGCSTAPSRGQIVTPLPLQLLRAGPGERTTDASVRPALREALYTALTERRPFPEAPIQARAAAASVKREILSELDDKGGRTMSYQGKKNIPKITVS